MMPDGGKSWCAGFWLKIFEELGFDVSGLNLMATSFKTFGYELPEIVDGAICVFEPKEDADFPIPPCRCRCGQLPETLWRESGQLCQTQQPSMVFGECGADCDPMPGRIQTGFRIGRERVVNSIVFE